MRMFANSAISWPGRQCFRLLGAFTLGLALTLSSTGSAFALSELKPATGEPAEPSSPPIGPGSPIPDETVPDDATGLPEPDPLINRPDDATTATEPVDDGPSANAEFLFDIEKAPEPVRRIRALIVEAAASGDIERLRPLLNPGPNQTQLTLNGDDDDPITVLKSFSGDDEGNEILAILLDLLSAGFARIDAGTPEEMYVWPYFAEKQITALTAPEKVEILRIVTAGDLANMLEYGNYNFFRIGITPTGEWKFFTAGD